MKKITSLLLLTAIVISCSKKDVIETNSTESFQIRVAAIENSGARSYTPISLVKSGKVAIEYETAEVSDVKEYNVQISSDGINFKTIKTITADFTNPNKLYRDTVFIE